MIIQTQRSSSTTGYEGGSQQLDELLKELEQDVQPSGNCRIIESQQGSLTKRKGQNRTIFTWKNNNKNLLSNGCQHHSLKIEDRVIPLELTTRPTAIVRLDQAPNPINKISSSWRSTDKGSNVESSEPLQTEFNDQRSRQALFQRLSKSLEEENSPQFSYKNDVYHPSTTIRTRLNKKIIDKGVLNDDRKGLSDDDDRSNISRFHSSSYRTHSECGNNHLSTRQLSKNDTGTATYYVSGIEKPPIRSGQPQTAYVFKVTPPNTGEMRRKNLPPMPPARIEHKIEKEISTLDIDELEKRIKQMLIENNKKEENNRIKQKTPINSVQTNIYEEEVISLLPIGRGVQNLEPEITGKNNIKYRAATPNFDTIRTSASRISTLKRGNSLDGAFPNSRNSLFTHQQHMNPKTSASREMLQFETLGPFNANSLGRNELLFAPLNTTTSCFNEFANGHTALTFSQDINAPSSKIIDIPIQLPSKRNVPSNQIINNQIQSQNVDIELKNNKSSNILRRLSTPKLIDQQVNVNKQKQILEQENINDFNHIETYNINNEMSFTREINIGDDINSISSAIGSINKNNNNNLAVNTINSTNQSLYDPNLISNLVHSPKNNYENNIQAKSSSFYNNSTPDVASGMEVCKQLQHLDAFNKQMASSQNFYAEMIDENNETYRQIKDTSQVWHKPHITREDAVNILRNKPAGSFVIRNSHSFSGGYGLALKVSQLPPNVQTKGDDIEANLVRHFLIESTKKGVKLKGCSNEPVFDNLAALIFQHTITPLSLPCKLIITDQASSKSSFKNCEIPCILENTNDNLEACLSFEALYIASVDTENLTGPAALQRSIRIILDQFNQIGNTVASVELRINQHGIVITDNQRRFFFRRHYPINLISFCGLESTEKEWTFNNCESNTVTGRIFGFVAKKAIKPNSNACHLFLEVDKKKSSSALVQMVACFIANQAYETA